MITLSPQEFVVFDQQTICFSVYCNTIEVVNENQLSNLFTGRRNKAVINNGLPASMDCNMGQNLIITEIHKSMMEIQNWPYLCISITKFLVSIIVYGYPQIESQSSIRITALLCIK